MNWIALLLISPLAQCRHSDSSEDVLAVSLSTPESFSVPVDAVDEERAVKFMQADIKSVIERFERASMKIIADRDRNLWRLVKKGKGVGQVALQEASNYWYRHVTDSIKRRADQSRQEIIEAIVARWKTGMPHLEKVDLLYSPDGVPNKYNKAGLPFWQDHNRRH